VEEDHGQQRDRQERHREDGHALRERVHDRARARGAGLERLHVQRMQRAGLDGEQRDRGERPGPRHGRLQQRQAERDRAQQEQVERGQRRRHDPRLPRVRVSGMTVPVYLPA